MHDIVFDSRHEREAFRRNLDANFSAIVGGMGAFQIVEVFQPVHQSRRRRRRVSHPPRDLRHGHRIARRQRREQKKLHERNVAAPEFTREIQEEPPLDKHQNASEFLRFRIRTRPGGATFGLDDIHADRSI